MVVEFRMKRVPAVRVATISWKGPWNERKIRAQFDRIAAWARSRGLSTGRWIFREPATRTWEVAIEVRGAARSDGAVHVRTYPAATVASVVFDPSVVSPSVVYHGVTDWLRWRKKDRTIRSVGTYREVYESDPWRVARAWARTDVQVVVRK
ncbi:MAG TPA: GyrI-like domain-containing protein [Thermoplasmata archaeon]|jgi:effector-binding domain-containing protein|nr:GyrI-like domain-containing protein [Thermoplasmata archaeon]